MVEMIERRRFLRFCRMVRTLLRMDFGLSARSVLMSVIE